MVEDRRALALAGREPLNLSFLDEQYRTTQLALAPVVEQIEGSLPGDVHLYAPAAFGAHTDHVLVRAAALELRTRGFDVSLYADLPHATLHGWPGWVTAAGAPTSADLAAALWDRTLADTGISPRTMKRTLHELGARNHARKLAAVRAYVTQTRGLVEFGGRTLTDRETLGYEVVWELPVRATCASVRAGRRVTPSH
jgi:hypothetical protein